MVSKKESFLKSIIWRVMGIFILALTTYLFTNSLIQTGLVTVLHHGIFLIVFYLHERLWLRIKIKGRNRMIYKALFYELVLGQGILGLITFVITGSLQTMTLITFTYIWNKLWIFMVYDWLWGKYGTVN